jgi:hypothetical protein
MTARANKYDDYRQALLTAGISGTEADEVIAGMKHIDTKVELGACPQCNAKLTRALDPRQDGPTKVAGKWFNYRCTARCGWFGDRCEPIGEN